MVEQVLYFVADIESNGPDPACHSMLSFATVVLRDDGEIVGEYEAVLKPISDRTCDDRTMAFWRQHPKAWEAATHGAELPHSAMEKFASWVRTFHGLRSFAARPLMFDGAWIDAYLRRFAGCHLFDVPYWGKPLFNAGPMDIGSYVHGLFARTEPQKSSWQIPKEWLGNHEHTHKAIDDARGYASLLSKLFSVARYMPRHPQDFLGPKR